MIAFLSQPWQWYVAGPLIGLFVPALLILGNRQFGFSSNLRHLCAALAPGEVAFFKYDWKQTGAWNLAFLAGTVAGGFIGGRLPGGHPRPTAAPAPPPPPAARAPDLFPPLPPPPVSRCAPGPTPGV